MNIAGLEVVHRYSVRTTVAFGLLWLIMLAGQAFGLFVTASQYLNRADTSFALPAMFALFVVLWLAVGLIWLRNRPTLELMAGGISISKCGSGRRFLRWADIQSIEEFKRFNVQTGRPLRFYEIHWHGGVVKFNQFYSHLPRLIARLNDEIRKHEIKVIIHDFEPRALRAALEASRTRAEKRRLRAQGLITNAMCLEHA